MSEGDKNKWRGIRPISPEEIFTRYEPPEGATYATGYGTASGNVITIGTVLANTKLFVTSFGLTLLGLAAGYGGIYIHDDTPAYLYHLGTAAVAINRGEYSFANLNLALQYPAGYTIQLSSSVANCLVYGWFNGYTRPV